jgi:hypothetical protein
VEFEGGRRSSAEKYRGKRRKIFITKCIDFLLDLKKDIQAGLALKTHPK